MEPFHVIQNVIKRTSLNEKEEKRKLYRLWKALINMTANELERFYNSPYGKIAGISREQQAESRKKGSTLRRGRDSARAIIRMKRKGVRNWNESDWEWAKHQIAFVLRMSRASGPLTKNTKNGLIPTRKYLSLMIWGFDPLKNRKGPKIWKSSR